MLYGFNTGGIVWFFLKVLRCDKSRVLSFEFLILFINFWSLWFFNVKLNICGFIWFFIFTSVVVFVY
ncbi:hypothetical protein N476_19455 [Pseudoalteromonas luteoviolacea H33]|uniref:Uncharacterized protein n=1 Tax=Pseudoalteromonas luteoviolacea H33 TaxID=1365251 RepID=A0A167DWG6_9GAMM|nr:hypothetical protein N476_19455 [Pseudoalteromonas luteoviolacea H33]KZN72604.1 hypothetical protein N477_24725 [Pseudoalteromonas luteoviolacea H33-S]